MHLTYTEFVFCKCLVQVWNFVNTANGTAARSSLTFLCSLLILILEQLPRLCRCSCFCSWLASLAGELIWQKTKLFSVTFSFALVSSHLHFSTAFPTAVELGLCGFLEILKWDLNIILWVCYLYLLDEEENSVPVLFTLAPRRKVNTWSLWVFGVRSVSRV